MRLTLVSLAVGLLATFAGGSPSANAGSIPDQCYAFIQGNVPWDYGGSTDWNPVNVERLCGETGHAAEPGRCFDRVMHGDVNWGGGTNWEWKNAIDLCASTGNAHDTIQCFTDQVAHDVPWQEAITSCKYAAAAPEPDDSQCYAYIQGNIPWSYDGATNWNPVNVHNLCGASSHAAEPGRCFDQVMNGGNVDWGGGTTWEWANAVDLCKGSENAHNTVACFKSQITGGESWQNAITACHVE